MFQLLLLTAVAQVVERMSENNRQIDGSDVLSALGVLLSNQLACKQCTGTDDQPLSLYPAPLTGQETNQNVPPAILNNTTPATATNNVELAAVNYSGELLRYVLRDVRKLKTAITRQRAPPPHDDTAKRHHVGLDVEELHQQKKERWNPRRTSLSDDDDDDDDDDRYQLNKGRHNANPPRYPTMTRDSRVAGNVRAKCDNRNINADRTEYRRPIQRLYENLEPLITRNRWSADGDVDGRNYDHSLPTSKSSTLWRNHYPSHPPPPERFTSSLGSTHHQNVGLHGSLEPRQIAAPYQPSQHLPHQQQNHPLQMQRQFHQQQMQMYPHQTPQQPQSGAFRPIHQVSPAQHQPLIFVPVHQHHQPYHHKQQQQQHEPFRPISLHSPDVSTRSNKQQVRSRSRWLTDAVKLANETKNLTAQIQKRQKHVVTAQRPRQRCYRL